MKRITAIMLAAILCLYLISPCTLAVSSTRETSLEQTLASDLKALSLFKGVSDTDFALSNNPTRIEAVVILIRMLGKESEAQSGTWTQPFSDVAPWAGKYIGYAYKQGLTKGVSDTEFGSGNASAATFLTLILRALGYSDANGDFSYSDPYSLASSIGLLPDTVDTNDFLRADVVLVSYAALSVKIKGTSQTLAEKLISNGVFSQTQFAKLYDYKAISEAGSNLELTAEQIYSKCSSAVFYIEVYDKDGNKTASGSGFFIDSNGTAVTNYHVVKGSYSAKVTVSDTKTVYNVLGVYDYSEDNDWAVLKIDASGVSYLNIGSIASVVGGAAVFAIGSPLGLQNTITSGIISNTSRTEDGVSYIQTNTSISSGSSGGALINKFGKVIGITSGSYVDGQNLNFALPITYISGFKSTSLMSYSDFTAESNISLDISKYNAEIKVGNSSMVYVYYTGDSVANLHVLSSDISVATVSSIISTTSDDIFKLVISAVNAGTATISVSDGGRHSFEISVTVSTNDPEDVLRQYIKTNGTYDSDYTDYYLGTTLSENTNCFIDYVPGENRDIYFTCYVEGDGYTVSSYLYVTKDDSAYFEIAYKYEATGVVIKGSGTITKSLFGSDSITTFQSYNGNQSYKDSFASLCSKMLFCSVEGAEYILADAKGPISVDDLGFNNIYFSYYTFSYK